jgi:2',3'-cyclic-nucleotide 2'-phosphodiesterase/3'-nucleotidase
VVKAFVSKKIGTFTHAISTKPAYFGPAAFIDFIHKIQLNLTKADISFTAPLSYDAEIPGGDIEVRDMFNLYKYENMLYTMRMSGKEVKGFLEMSYAMWTNQMKSADDHILLLKETLGSDETYFFKNFSFNFDSAAGIIYTVDVTKPEGEKITIVSMADGTPFDENKMYKVAMNSYRGNGGGELLTKGAGIPQDELKSRIISSTSKDLRYFMMNYIEDKGILNPQSLNQWKFIPEDWAKMASERDYKLLFGEK